MSHLHQYCALKRHLLIIAFSMSLCLGLLGDKVTAGKIEPITRQQALNLQLDKAFLINGPTNLEPSGLTFCQSALYMVSDKHTTIYQLNLNQQRQSATLSHHRHYDDLPAGPKVALPFWRSLTRWFHSLAAGRIIDSEGLSCDPEGNFYVASEYYLALITVPKAGKPFWQSKSYYRTGSTLNLFTKNNAYLEALVWQPTGFIVAAEREPRGLMHVKGDALTHYWVQAAFKDDADKTFDFTGLSVHNNTLYTLERNHYQICLRDIHRFTVKRCYSYRQTELESPWAYQHSHYGRAEGLAVNGQYIWVILDNNQKPRLANADDRRSVLFQFFNPLTTQ